MSFSFNHKKDSDLLVLSFEGTLVQSAESDEVDQLVEAHIAEDNKKLLVDLSKLSNLNSSGLNVLITYLTKMRNAGGDLILTGLNNKVAKLFLITKLNAIFDVETTLEEGMSKF